jgi:hypothetical protein
MAIAVKMIGIEIKKDTDNLSDYQCLTLILRGFYPIKSGGGGN